MLTTETMARLSGTVSKDLYNPSCKLVPVQPSCAAQAYSPVSKTVFFSFNLHLVNIVRGNPFYSFVFNNILAEGLE